MSEEEGTSYFPVTFEKCPHCGHTETLTKLAWQEEITGESRDMQVASRQAIVQLIDPRKGIGLTATALVLRFDICANPKCGLERCVGALKVKGPVKAQMPGQPGQKQMPPGGFPGMGNPRGN